MRSRSALSIFLLNLAGRVLPLVVTLGTFPIVIRYLGVDRYGLVGISNSILALASVIDIAFSNTINREIALHGSQAGSTHELGATIRTIEIMAWAAGAVLALVLVMGGSLLEGWVGAGKYSSEELSAVVRWMGLMALLQVPISFYGGSLYGLGRHDINNFVTLTGAIAGSLLAVAFVARLEASIGSYLMGQFLGRLVILAAMFVAARHLLRRLVPITLWRPSRSAMRRHWRFALGMNGLGALNLAGMQADIVVASRLLPAAEMGYYTIARTIAQTLSGLSMPAYLSAFPELTRQLGTGNADAFRSAFHKYAQLLSVALVPAVLVLGVFGSPIVWMWTGNRDLAYHVEPLLQFLLAGATFYGAGVMFSAVLMAHGAVRRLLLIAALYLILVVVSVPELGTRWGARGVGLGSAVAALGALACAAWLCRDRLEQGSLRAWFRRDILMPAVVAAAPILAARAVFKTEELTVGSTFVLVLSVAFLSLAAAAFALPHVRGEIALLVNRRR